MANTLRCFITWRDKRAEIVHRAEVDPKLFAALRRHSWNAFTTMTAGKVYFRRTGRGGRTILLHREVMRLLGVKPPSSSHKTVDHRDGNECDCRGRNLRWATYSENNRNRRRWRRSRPTSTALQEAVA